MYHLQVFFLFRLYVWFSRALIWNKNNPLHDAIKDILSQVLLFEVYSRYLMCVIELFDYLSSGRWGPRLWFKCARECQWKRSVKLRLFGVNWEVEFCLVNLTLYRKLSTMSHTSFIPPSSNKNQDWYIIVLLFKLSATHKSTLISFRNWRK